MRVSYRLLVIITVAVAAALKELQAYAHGRLDVPTEGDLRKTRYMHT